MLRPADWDMSLLPSVGDSLRDVYSRVMCQVMLCLSKEIISVLRSEVMVYNFRFCSEDERNSTLSYEEFRL
jgi:hypothetical protein